MHHSRRMRPRLQTALICGVIICIVLFLLKKHQTPTYPPNFILLDNTDKSKIQTTETNPYCGTQVESLTCLLNGYSTTGCYLINSSRGVVDLEIVKYWHEVTGYVDRTANSLILQTDESEFIENTKPYSAFGEYMDMGHSQPEARKFVKILDPDLNIPISCQWNPAGHHYVVQVAQYGLSHFSQLKLLESAGERQTMHLQSLDQPVADLKMEIFKPQMTNGASWRCMLELVGAKTGSNEAATCHFGVDRPAGANVIASIDFQLNASSLNSRMNSIFVIGNDWSPMSRLILQLKSKEGILFSELHYTCSNTFGFGKVFVSDEKLAVGYRHERILKIVYFLSACASSSKNVVKLTRNFNLDVSKGISELLKKWPKYVHLDAKATFFVQTVRLTQPSNSTGGVIADFALFELPTSFEAGLQADSVYARIVKRFLEIRLHSTANWLLDNQMADGSWQVLANREFTKSIVLKSGWCSAMGQGQAISLLVRMFKRTGDQRYLNASIQALAPFMRSIHAENDSGDCAVRADFLGQPDLPFFEEYPAQPSVFVLNGFIFSLIGLFDLSQVDHLNLSEAGNVSFLFKEGVNTLSKVLPLYDSGAGSFYDLRHLSLRHSLRHSNILPRLPTRGNRPDIGATELKDVLKAGPNRARMGYHHVHLKQLQLLTVIAPQYGDLWDHTLDRWLAYTWGFHSGHN